ncbi:MAG TPA: hypothetical protein DCS55_23170 [Acidimicrobiaceae bacterium]|nr:hypothetical protein [Acidimicrobiaceae bacterium]
MLGLQDPARIREVVLTSPDAGWSATIHVSSEPGASLADWGPPVATVDGAASGEHTVDLDAEGGHVLVWITDLGDGGEVIFELQEAEVRGR